MSSRDTPSKHGNQYGITVPGRLWMKCQGSVRGDDADSLFWRDCLNVCSGYCGQRGGLPLPICLLVLHTWSVARSHVLTVLRHNDIDPRHRSLAQEGQGSRAQGVVPVPFRQAFECSVWPFGTAVRCSFRSSVGSCFPVLGRFPGQRELVSAQVIQRLGSGPGGPSAENQDMDAGHGAGRSRARLLRTEYAEECSGPFEEKKLG